MKLDKLIYVVIGILGLTNQVFAEYRHPTQAPSVNISSSDNGTALAIAASQHRYRTTEHMEVSIGVGYFENNSAISVGVGTKVDHILINGSIGSDTSGSLGGGFGATFRF